MGNVLFEHRAEDSGEQHRPTADNPGRLHPGKGDTGQGGRNADRHRNRHGARPLARLAARADLAAKRAVAKQAATALRSRWYHMVARCHDPGSSGYADYGARGIAVHRTWRGEAGLRRFAEHIGPCPGDGYTVGRIDNERGYEPGNVRWETWTEQQNNRRSNVRLTHDGLTMTLAQWAARTGINRQLIQCRKADGWDLRVAATTPVGVRKVAAHERVGIAPAGASPRRRK